MTILGAPEDSLGDAPRHATHLGRDLPSPRENGLSPGAPVDSTEGVRTQLCVVPNAQQHYVVPGRTVSGEKIAVFGIYPNRPTVEYGLTLVRHAGFHSTDVSVLFPEDAGAKGLAAEEGKNESEVAMAGVASGSVIPGEFRWLVTTAPLAIPGLGSLIAAGPIVAPLAVIGTGGADLGFTGALMEFGVSEHKAKRYERRILDGAILLSIHCGNLESSSWAKEVLSASGAEDISSTS
jgi:hypothetical protein